MPSGRKRATKADEEESLPTVTQGLGLARIGNLLALMLVQGKTQNEQIGLLTAAGFAAAEIATLLNTTPGNVRTARYKYKAKRNG